MNLNDWNTKNVINMKRAFYNSSFCCGDISKWDTSNVLYMEEMFSRVGTIKIDLSTKQATKTVYQDLLGTLIPYKITWTAWDVWKVLSMKDIFLNSSFYGSLNTWNVRNITDTYDFWPKYIQLKWFAKWRWPKNTNGRDPYFWENFSPVIL
nr:hypothetical protein MF5292_00655 [Mycoplasma feriruminatoris]